MALDMVREIEVAGDAIEEIPPRPCVTLEEACDKFLLDVVARDFSEPILYKYRLLLGRLKVFALKNNLAVAILPGCQFAHSLAPRLLGDSIFMNL